jgi:hypothetical protein
MLDLPKKDLMLERILEKRAMLIVSFARTGRCREHHGRRSDKMPPIRPEHTRFITADRRSGLEGKEVKNTPPINPISPRYQRCRTVMLTIYMASEPASIKIGDSVNKRAQTRPSI